MNDNDDLPVGVSVITPHQFKAKESYWAGQWADETNDNPFVLWSPIGREVLRETIEKN